MGIFGRKQQETIFDASRVDLVALDEKESTVELFIVNDAGWSGSVAQVESLQMKIQAYVSYAMDGPMVATYPTTEGLPWRIVVHAQTGPPDQRTAEVLAAIAERLPAYGGGLETRVGDAA